MKRRNSYSTYVDVALATAQRANFCDFRRDLASEGEPKLNKINNLLNLLIRWSQVRVPHGLPEIRRGLSENLDPFSIFAFVSRQVRGGAGDRGTYLILNPILHPYATMAAQAAAARNAHRRVPRLPRSCFHSGASSMSDEFSVSVEFS
jgi:hypothetical protein